MMMVEGIEFSTWLEDQIAIRGWRPIDLANAANVPAATISRILNGDRKAGADVANAIAKALHLPPEHVFRKAGLLPNERDEAIPPDPTIRELVDILGKADEEDRREIVEYALWYLRRKNNS